MLKKFLLFSLLFVVNAVICQDNIVISGYIKNSDTKEVLLFTKVFVVEAQKGVISNEYGFFSIEVPVRETYSLKLTAHDQETSVYTIDGTKSLEQDFFMGKYQHLIEVTVSAEKIEREEIIKNTEVSVLKIDIHKAKLLPTMGGETDILKVAQLLPGINRGLEGGTNFFVRGGDGDQNLILVDEATVYNPGHLLGFFSVFNPDVIKEMTIYKGGFPANYSGRLSSITDIRTIDGDKSKFHGTGGIGMLSSRLTLEGPILKDKMSFMLSGRRSYIDQLSKLTLFKIPFYFYDLNGKINYNINQNNKLFLSSYYGRDVLNFNENESNPDDLFGFGFTLGNFTQTLRWSHIFSPKLFSTVTLLHTQFDYDIDGKFGQNNILIRSAIRDLSIKYDFQYFKSAETKIQYGIVGTNHRFRPNVISSKGEISEIIASKEGKTFSTFETNMYFDIKHRINSKLQLDAGLSLPQSMVKEKLYAGVSPRLNLAYQLNEIQALKISLSRMYQFMHRVSSSTVALPTDLWYPISKNIKPQVADQVALSYNVNLKKLKSYIVVEGYYKHMNNLTEYKEGSQLIFNDAFESMLVQGKGWSSGLEFLFRKDEGKLTGWIGYTLSYTKRRFEELNEGKPFWAKYDRRHYFTLVTSYAISDRFAVSAIFEISNGSRFTPIIGQYFQPNPGLTDVETIPIFAERNSIQMSPSHRLDLNFIIRSKKKRKYEGEWHIGGYNIYNRATPYRVDIEQQSDGSYKYVQPGLFGFVPSIGYNFKF